jgi:nicotinamide-nucleotide amidase
MLHTRRDMNIEGRPDMTSEAVALERSARLADLLRAGGLTCATAESCTGGLIGHRITALAGSSDYFMGGVIAYTNDAKQKLLGVPGEILQQVGAVSPECARAMADGARAAFSTDLGIASTGIAGPSGATARKPVGLIYIAVATPETTEVRELRLHGGRLENIRETALQALELAISVLQPSTTTPNEME